MGANHHRRRLTARALAWCAATLIASPAHGEPLAFKGFALGGSRAEFLARFPDFRCTAHICSFSPGISCSGTTPAARDCVLRNTYGGIVPVSITAIFHEELLDAVMVSYSPKHFEVLAEAATERFGPPKTTEEERLRTQLGVEYLNITHTWAWTEGMLRVSRFGRTIDQGTVSITSAAMFQRSLERVRRSKERAPKDL